MTLSESEAEKSRPPTRDGYGSRHGRSSEDLHHLDAVLARRPGEIEAAVQRAGIMLVGEVGGIAGHRPAAMLPGELRVDDVAIGQPVAERSVLEQCRPLRTDMAEI